MTKNGTGQLSAALHPLETELPPDRAPGHLTLSVSSGRAYFGMGRCSDSWSSTP